MASDIAFWVRFSVVSVAGWMNQEQLEVIEYLKDENKTLRRAIKSKRIRLSLEDRRRLGAKGRGIGRNWLKDVATIACADTILAWYRDLVAKKWTFHRKGPGRPRSPKDIREMIVKMARENLTWGYTRIMGALKNVGMKTSRGTICKRAEGEPPTSASKYLGSRQVRSSCATVSRGNDISNAKPATADTMDAMKMPNLALSI